jgi:hypothetical protein
MTNDHSPTLIAFQAQGSISLQVHFRVDIARIANRIFLA